MATARDNIKQGAGVVSFGDYVSAKGAATLVDVGYLGSQIELHEELDHHPIEVQQHLAPVRMVPTKRGSPFKVVMAEADVEKLRLMTEQPTANVSGSGLNKTILVDADAPEQYHQVTIAYPGPGTNKLRTRSYWRCVCTKPEMIPIAKETHQLYAMTVVPIYEDTGSGADSLYKQVDT